MGILPRASSSASKGSIRKMRVPRAFLFLALVASLTSTAYAQVECNLARAIELNPCKADEGKELTADEKDTCCKGIFQTQILLPNTADPVVYDRSDGGGRTGTADLWAASGCFCIPAIMNDDLPFFNAVLDIAKTCGASYGNINTIDCDSTVTTSCTSGFKSTDCSGITVGTTVSNGFVGKSQAQMKADVA